MITRTVYLNGRRFVQTTARHYLPYSRVAPGLFLPPAGDFTLRTTFAYRNAPETGEWPVIINSSVRDV